MVLTFGKFKGKTVSEVLEIEPSYIAWAATKGLLFIDKETLLKAINAYNEERNYAEAMFEAEHSDWGNRD